MNASDLAGEQWYDAEVAPVLLDLANKCGDKGMAFVSVVEYALGSRGTTARLPDGSGLAMLLLNHCAKSGENIDAYVIGVGRYAIDHGIDTSASVVMNLLGRPT